MITINTSTFVVEVELIDKIDDEVDRAYKKFGKEQDIDTLLFALVEETGECAKARNEKTSLEEELIHVAATAIQCLQAIERDRNEN